MTSPFSLQVLTGINDRLKAMASFDSCALEVKRQILGHLKNGDLREFCAVNKASQIVAEWMLYSAVEITWTDLQDTRFVALVRSIVHRRERALEIRSLKLQGANFCMHARIDPSRWPYKIQMPEEDADALVTFVGTLAVPFQDAWQQGLRQGSVDALLALLLSQTPNLTVLFVGPNFDGMSHLLGQFLRYSLFQSTDQRLSRLQHLEEVSFGLDWDRSRVGHITVYEREAVDRNTLELLPFFYLPCLRRFAACLDDSPLAFEWPATTAPNSTTIKSLELDFIREHQLENILSATTRLESLRWRCHPAACGGDDSDPMVDLDQVVAAVSNVRDTLADLSITLDVSVCGGLLEAPKVRTQGSLGGLIAMDKIKTFCVSFVLLMGGMSPEDNPSARMQDSIPRNVEHITITDDQFLNENWTWTMDEMVRPYLDAFQAWLDVWREFHPRLQRVTLNHVHLWFDLGWGPGSGRKELEDMFSRAGVTLELPMEVENHDDY